MDTKLILQSTLKAYRRMLEKLLLAFLFSSREELLTITEGDAMGVGLCGYIRENYGSCAMEVCQECFKPYCRWGFVYICATPSYSKTKLGIIRSFIIRIKTLKKIINQWDTH